jgi:hypothetical protein
MLYLDDYSFCGEVIAEPKEVAVVREMKKPNLDRMWETWIKIGIPQGYQELFNRAVSIIRSQVSETVSVLETREMIDWYQFLIHGKENDGNLYFHIRFSLRNGTDSKDFLDSLPSYCLDPKHIERRDVESISGILKTLLKNDEIEEAWRIIGEQSEWIIHMVSIHKDGGIPIQQFIQFMHFYTNMIGLGHQSILQLSPFFRF